MEQTAPTPKFLGNAFDRTVRIPAFEEQLAQNAGWALSEGSKFFEGGGAVKESLRKIIKRLAELGIPYAVVGGMALSYHGFPRFTVDVDLLVTAEGLKKIHEHLVGLGYVPPFNLSKNLRDTETGVKIEFLVMGQYPGDGKPKPVSFPDPAAVAVEKEGIKVVNLPTLIELKIASGISSPDRMKDLADVQELIKILNLPADFGSGLNPYVQGKYAELWQAAHPPQKKYVIVWTKSITSDPKSLPEMIASLERGVHMLRAMLADGVTLDPSSGSTDGYYLVTMDPEVAKKYDMHEESEFMKGTDEQV